MIEKIPFTCLVLLFIFFGKCKAQLNLPGLQPDTIRLQKGHDLESEALRTRDSLLLGKAYFLIAEAYNVTGQNTVSGDYYLKAINTLKPRGDSYELAKSYLRLNQGLHIDPFSKEGIDNANKALLIFQRLHSDKGMSLAYNYLTSAFKASWVWNKRTFPVFRADPAKLDTLHGYMNNIENHARQAKDTNMIGEAHLQRGDLYRHLKDKKAFLHLDEALGLFKMAGNDTAVIHTLCIISATYLEMGNYRKAGQFLKKTQDMAKISAIKEYWLVTHILELEIEYYVATKQWEKAYETSDKHSKLKQYRQAGERDYLYKAMNLKYETEKKDALLGIQKAELKNLDVQRRFTIATSILLVVSLVAAIILFRLNRKNQRISRQNQELVKEQNHRVKNNLQVVSSLLALHADQLTDPAAWQAIKESQMRVQSIAILHQELYDGTELARGELQEFIPKLTGSVFQTFGLYLKPVFDIDPVYLSADKATPLGLILNELITNSCKYAFPRNPDPQLRISCRRQGHSITLKVEDNGPGLSKNLTTAIPIETLLLEQSGTFGIPLIHSQVAQLNATARFGPGETGNGISFSMDFNF